MLLGMYAQILCGCITGLVDVFELHMMFRCLSAICCGLMYTAGGVIISENQRVMLLMLTAMVSKATISVALSILTTCTTELVSQPMKKGAAYSATVWARIWLLGAPFIGATIIFGQLIPQTAFGSLTIIGGIIIGGIHSPRTHPLAKKETFYEESICTSKNWLGAENKK
uniref:(northern house mosquito) hypothetical protein n=1 Tax=Culex pipiens TaxID=7175 RepID=A0A8D8HMM8_CULPI